jgi:hypothetical protein
MKTTNPVPPHLPNLHPIRTSGREYVNPVDYQHPYDSLPRFADLLALRYDANRTRHAYYRQLRCIRPLLSGRFELRLSSRAVPDVENLHGPGLLGHIIKDAKRSIHNLSQWTCCTSWIGRANEWKRCQNPSMIENRMSQPCRHP